MTVITRPILETDVVGYRDKVYVIFDDGEDEKRYDCLYIGHTKQSLIVDTAPADREEIIGLVWRKVVGIHVND